jgi:hypothetical protein
MRAGSDPARGKYPHVVTRGLLSIVDENSCACPLGLASAATVLVRPGCIGAGGMGKMSPDRPRQGSGFYSLQTKTSLVVASVLIEGFRSARIVDLHSCWKRAGRAPWLMMLEIVFDSARARLARFAAGRAGAIHFWPPAQQRAKII